MNDLHRSYAEALQHRCCSSPKTLNGTAKRGEAERFEGRISGSAGRIGELLVWARRIRAMPNSKSQSLQGTMGFDRAYPRTNETDEDQFMEFCLYTGAKRNAGAVGCHWRETGNSSKVAKGMD